MKEKEQKTMSSVVIVVGLLVALLVVAGIMWKKPSSTSPNKFSQILYVCAAIAIILIAVWSYRYYVLRPYEYNANLERQKNVDKNENQIQILVFTADWCPACRRASAPIKHVQEKYDNKQNSSGKTVVFVFYDCTDLEDTGENAEVRESYQVKAFPTLIAQHKHKTVHYEGAMNDDNLESFIEGVQW